ncbi:MAG: sugar ABC transporter permease [Saccharofermentans sp.]|nr:sugar ABC transporter permease [Saccharofermentans sp.]
MRRKKLVSYAKYGYLFSIPFVLAFLMFMCYPTIYTLILGFTDLKGAGRTDFKFLTEIGKPWYQNYKEVLTAKTFKKAFSNTWILWGLSVIPEYLIAMTFAVWFTDRKLRLKGRGLFKILFYMPRIITGVAMATLFARLFGYPKGAFNDLCNAVAGWFGITRQNFNYLDKDWTVKLVIIIVNVYMYFGGTMVVMISAIMGIDVEIFEAAEIDGANRFQTFFKVTLPCMRQMLIYMLVMSVIGGLTLFEVPAMMAGIGCNNAGLTNLMYIQNQAFSGSYIYNRAAAASVILALLCVGLSCIIFFILRDKDEVKIKKLRRAAKREERRRLAAI